MPSNSIEGFEWKRQKQIQWRCRLVAFGLVIFESFAFLARKWKRVCIFFLSPCLLCTFNEATKTHLKICSKLLFFVFCWVQLLHHHRHHVKEKYSWWKTLFIFKITTTKSCGKWKTCIAKEFLRKMHKSLNIWKEIGSGRTKNQKVAKFNRIVKLRITTSNAKKRKLVKKAVLSGIPNF